MMGRQHTEGDALADSAARSDHILLKIAGIMLAALAICLAPAVLGVGSRPRVPTSRPTSPSLEAYRGLGTWVSIYDRRAWADPASAVAAMARRGVKTLFIQTGNSNSKGVVYDPSAQQTFITAAHANGMKVVAWYLPEMKDAERDLQRIAQAIALRTVDGQGFDSFALDIESTAIHDLNARNQALAAMTARLRALVGRSYALGAIIPSPVGLAKKTGFWDVFPYEAVGRAYDVVLPMGYYTYHGKGAPAVAKDVGDSMSLLRAQPGCAKVPVHMIGGLAAKSNATEVMAFAGAVANAGCIGASLYSWSGTSPSEWTALTASVR
jgi:hypothetical protein